MSMEEAMPAPSTQDPTPPAIAVLGTGRMGAPIAHNLLAAGFEVSVWGSHRGEGCSPRRRRRQARVLGRRGPQRVLTWC